MTDFQNLNANSSSGVQKRGKLSLTFENDFRFRQKNSKWPQKATFYWITRYLQDEFFLSSQNLLQVWSKKKRSKWSLETGFFAKYLRNNWRIFISLMAYVHFRKHSHIGHFGCQNLLPVCFKNLKWPSKPFFSRKNLRSNGQIFKIQRNLLSRHIVHILKVLILRIYFRFAQKTSKWPPETKLFSE